MLGMSAGDRMTQANGIALASVDDVLLALVKPLVANQAGPRRGHARRQACRVAVRQRGCLSRLGA